MTTVNRTNNVIQLTSITGDWDLSTTSSISSLNALEPGIPLKHILFTPGASRDVMVIKERNANGSEIFRAECANSYDQKIIPYYGNRHKPFVDFSDCTLSVGHKLNIEYE